MSGELVFQEVTGTIPGPVALAAHAFEVADQVRLENDWAKDSVQYHKTLLTTVLGSPDPVHTQLDALRVLRSLGHSVNVPRIEHRLKLKEKLEELEERGGQEPRIVPLSAGTRLNARFRKRQEMRQERREMAARSVRGLVPRPKLLPPPSPQLYGR